MHDRQWRVGRRKWAGKEYEGKEGGGDDRVCCREERHTEGMKRDCGWWKGECGIEGVKESGVGGTALENGMNEKMNYKKEGEGRIERWNRRKGGS